MKNREIANILMEIADNLQIQGVEWKPNAYRKAARSIETLAEPIEKIYKEEGTKGLKTIPGIGEGIAKKIEEYLKTGKIKEFQRLSKKIPKGVKEMIHIPSLGPKKVLMLYKKLKIKSISELKKAIKSGRVRKLAGFGAKSEQDIIRGLGLVAQRKKRSLLGEIFPVARELRDIISKVPGVKKVELAGSLRRMKESIGDIDILAISSKPTKVMDVFTNLPNVKTVLAKGPTKSTIILKEGFQSDLRVLDDKSFGAALQYFTGNKDHNVAVRQIAIKKGYKLSEYGLFKKNKYIAGRTEADVYKKLGLAYIEPELRQNTGEIDAAKKGALPKLITLKDIKGDLHLHTRWSDGNNSTAEMISQAQKMGYKYIAITDHSKSQRIANGLDEKTLQKHIDEVKKLRKKYRIKIFMGSEVDILSDGSLDYSDAILKKLDWVVASVHSGFKMDKAKMTKRLIKAIENPHVNAIGHPTGRLIHAREPYQVDLAQIFSSAAKNNVALEINSHPSRLDLKDIHIRKALEHRCKIVINTDSHSIDHFRFIEFGVAQARRGWCEAKNVINTWPLSKLERFLKK